jgi:hypothetical protein
MNWRWLFPAMAAPLLGACAQAEQATSCVAAECHASCLPLSGSCIDGRCICSRTDGGGDADVGECTTAACDATCRAGGYTGGACVGVSCQCTGTPPDGGGDADAGADADADAGETGADEAGAEDAAGEEASARDGGDPCTVDDLVEQLYCGEGMKCAFSSLSGSAPDPVCDRAGARALNTNCTGYSLSDTCEPGLMCLNDGSGSRCRRLCRDDADCRVLGPRAGCLIGITIGGTTTTGIKACTLDCDVLLGSGCDATQACRPNFVDTGGGIFVGYSDCSGVGTGTQGADCSTRGSADCAARYQCFNLSTGETECLYICELARAGLDCPAPAYTCNDISDPTSRLGACL